MDKCLIGRSSLPMSSITSQVKISTRFGCTLKLSLFLNTGFVNVIIFLATRRFFPDVGSLPEFTTPRKQFRESFVASGGVLPFPLGQSAEKKEENESVGQVPQQSLRSSRRFSVSTLDTTSSQTPLRLPERVLTFFSKPERR